MLILSRRVDESIMIGNDVKMTIIGVKGKQIRIAFDAPDEVKIHREEIFDRIKKGEPSSVAETII